MTGLCVWDLQSLYGTGANPTFGELEICSDNPNNGWGTGCADHTSLLNWLDGHSPLLVDMRPAVTWQALILNGLLHYRIYIYSEPDIVKVIKNG